MALRNIIFINNDILRKISRSVEKIDGTFLSLLDDMSETMHHEKSAGLSAPQIGISRRLIVIDIKGKVVKMINPIIIESYGNQCVLEGCLSIPHIYGKVNRPEKLIVKSKDENGQFFQLECKGFLARVVCHEIDHLDGILFTDKIIPGSVINREYLVSQGGKDDFERKISLRL